MAELKLKLGYPGAEKEFAATVADTLPPVWDLDRPLKVAGTSVQRLDALAKVTGRAKYASDVNPAGMLFGRILRCPHAHAVLKSLDTAAAEAMPGVKALVLAFDKAQVGTKRLRYAGDEILAVAADSAEKAEDAIRAVKAVYEILPFVADLDSAMKDGAPVVHSTAAPQVKRSEGDVGEAHGGAAGTTATAAAKADAPKTNVRPGKPRGDRAAADKAMDASAKRVETTYRTQVQGHCALESHGLVAMPTADGGLKVWASTQGVFSVRDGLAEALELPKEKVEVIAHHVGGGFGAKFGPRPEGLMAARLALKTKAPVRMMLDRREEHTATGNRPDSLQRVALGAGADGKLTAAVISTHGTPGVAGGGAGVAIPLVYSVPTVFKDEANVHTNAGAAAAMRAPGHPQASFAFEQSVDQLALDLGIDPLEFRLRNDPSATRRAQFKLAAERIGWKGPGKAMALAGGAGGQASPLRRGIGMAGAQWFSGGGKGAHADVEIHRDGKVVLKQGAQDIGQGFRTAMAIVVAETLGLAASDIDARVGETGFGYGPGSGGSTTTPSVAPAVHAAAWNALARLTDVVAAHWGIERADVLYADGVFSPRATLTAPPKPLEGADGGDATLLADAGAGSSAIAAAATPTARMKPLPFAKACRLMPGDKITAGGDRPDDLPKFGGGVGGAQFAEVEVDVETGRVRVLRVVAVQDAGRTLNELAAKGQIAGAVLQGLGYALFEGRVMDRRHKGTMLNANFTDYKLPGPADCPEIEAIVFQVANGGNTLGVLGMAEAPVIPTAAAIANAVADAIGVRVLELPITPDRVLAALSAKAAKGATS